MLYYVILGNKYRSKWSNARWNKHGRWVMERGCQERELLYLVKSSGVHELLHLFPRVAGLMKDRGVMKLAKLMGKK